MAYTGTQRQMGPMVADQVGLVSQDTACLSWACLSWVVKGKWTFA